MAALRGGRTSAKKKNSADVAEEQAQCYRLRLAGMTLEQIAKQTDLSKATVHNRITAQIKETVEPLAEEVRKMQLDRLDEWLMHLNGQIRQGRQVARSIEVALRVEERRAKLMGVDAPEKTQSEHSFTASPDLQERIAAAQALLRDGVAESD